MNISTDTINSAMSLAGGALALLAAIVSAAAVVLPKETAAAAIMNIRTKITGYITVLAATFTAISIVVFDSLGFALFFVFICASLISTQFLCGNGPIKRGEVFVLIIQVAIFLAFALLYFGSRFISRI